MSEFRRPDPLKPHDEPTQKIRCPVHGFIHYSSNERKIIDHPIFRRLRAIRQLALTEYVYPGATHTRFEHSLGVMEVVTRAFMSLCERHGETLEKHLGRYPYFREEPLKRARQILRLAALLHDSGHAPFSHAAEEVIQVDGGKHEDLSIKIIASDEIAEKRVRSNPTPAGPSGNVASEDEWDELTAKGLRPLLDGTWGKDTAQTVASLLKKVVPAHLQLLKDLISGEIDADRMDYLLRDSHHCGVDYGRFDCRRLIECLSISVNEEGIPQMGLDDSGLQTYEALILARFQMNVQVYYHRVRRIYDHYLRQYHQAIRGTVFGSLCSILQENDFTMLARIQRDAADPESPGHSWAKRIADRRHHGEVYAFDLLEWNVEGAEKEKWIKRKFATLRDSIPDADLVLDLCEEKKPISLHKLIQSGDDRADEKATEGRMKLIRRDGSEDLLVPHQLNPAQNGEDLRP